MASLVLIVAAPEGESRGSKTRAALPPFEETQPRRRPPQPPPGSYTAERARGDEETRRDTHGAGGVVVGVHATGAVRPRARKTDGTKGGRGRWGSGWTRVDPRARTCPTRHPPPHRLLPSSPLGPGGLLAISLFVPARAEPDCPALAPWRVRGRRDGRTDAANSCG